MKDSGLDVCTVSMPKQKDSIMREEVVTRTSRIRRIGKRIPGVLAVYRLFQSALSRFLLEVFPLSYVKKRFMETFKRKIDLDKPVTYSEKMVWLMYYWKHPLKTLCGDKFSMRSYVEEMGCKDVLQPLLGDYNSPSEIDFDALPNRFVLKCSHGCGYNIICKNKSTLDIDKTRRQLARWMRTDYSKVAGEPHYHGMTPRIICEPFLDELSEELPIDYKLYCINGKVFCCDYLKGRSMMGHSIIETMYNREWVVQKWLLKDEVLAENIVPPPPGFRRMVEVAEMLSKPFPFVRVDFYSINGRAILGEMTFTSAGGISAAWTDEAQIAMGTLIQLPEKKI